MGRGERLVTEGRVGKRKGVMKKEKWGEGRRKGLKRE